MKPSQPKIPKLSPALIPRLRLFLSVDLVGSTAFKQAQKNHIIPKEKLSDLPQAGPAWFKSILSFYRDFESILLTDWEDYNKTCADLKLPGVVKPEFWKSVGDELLYTFDISHPREAAGVLIIWISTLENYRKILKANTPTLDIKASAWIAGFPLMNSEVIFEHSPEKAKIDDALVHQFALLNKWYKSPTRRDNLSKDYVGPAIDTGFRISSNASPRKLIISVDLALLITGVSLDTEVQSKFRIFFEGTQTFKGVVGGRPYPVLWIAVDGGGKLVEHEDKLAGRSASEHSLLKAYCEEYIKSNSDYLIRPFICDCSDDFFAEMPIRYMERLEHTERFFKRETTLVSSQKKSLEAEDKDGEIVDSIAIESFTGGIPIEAEVEIKE